MIPQMISNGQIADNVVQIKDVDIGMLETPKKRYFQLFSTPKLFAELEERLFIE